MKLKSLLRVQVAAIAFSAIVAHADGLVGWDATYVYSIDTSTGEAQSLFEHGAIFAGEEASSLTYDPTSAHLFGIAGTGYSFDTYMLVDIDLAAQTAQRYAFTGGDFIHREGLEWLASENALVMSGSYGSTETNRLCTVSATGVMAMSVEVAPVTDLDTLVSNFEGGGLYGWDHNTPTDGYHYFEVTNPMSGSGGYVGLYNGPAGSDYDAAILPSTGEVFVTNRSGLVKLDLANQVQTSVGAYGAGITRLDGIAAVPEPGTMLALGAGVAALMARRSRRER